MRLSLSRCKQPVSRERQSECHADFESWSTMELSLRLLMLLLAGCVMLCPRPTRGWPYGRADCAPCRCHIETGSHDVRFRGRTADCRHQALTDIPVYLPPDTDHLLLSNNSIRSIRESSLRNYHYLKTLRIDHNALVTIEPDVFERSPLLYYLDIAYNDLQVLPDLVFRKAPLLRELHGVRMQELPGHIFHNLTKLRTLSIDVLQEDLPAELFENLFITKLHLNLTTATSLPSCLLRPISTTLREFSLVAPELQSLEQTVFDSMVLLHKLYIKAPKMNTLPEDMFHGERLLPVDMTQLAHEVVADVFDSILAPQRAMRLSDVTLEGIKELPEKLFRQSPYIEHLEIHGSEVIPDMVFKNLRRLNHLDLSGNGITKLPTHWFEDLDGLKELDLSHNKIRNVSHQLMGLQSIKVLDLSHNDLRNIDELAFTSFQASVEELFLEQNVLTVLPPGLFDSMWSLQHLDLSRNFLSVLPALVFEDLQKLKSLRLQQNHLIFLHEDSLLGLQELTLLNLQDNYISSFPRQGLQEATSLHILDLSKNSLKELAVGTLTHNHWLHTVRLVDNPLVCGCGVRQLQDLSEEQDTNVTGVCTIYANATAGATPPSSQSDLLEVNVTAVCMQEQIVPIDQRPVVITRFPPPKPTGYATGNTAGAKATETPGNGPAVPDDELVKRAQVSGGSSSSDNYFLEPLLWTVGCAFLLICVVLTLAFIYKMRGRLFARSYTVRERERQE